MRCPACDAPNPSGAVRCQECGERFPRRRRRDEGDYEEDEGADETVATIIPYRNIKALIAYYLGVFGMIPVLGLILGPAALILGVMGLRYVRAQPHARGTGHAITGIILGSLATLVNYGCIVFMAAGGAMARFSR